MRQKVLLVTELARLPTYTLGITELLVRLEQFGLSRQATWMGCIRRRVLSLYSPPGRKYIRGLSRISTHSKPEIAVNTGGISLPGCKVYCHSLTFGRSFH